MIILSKRLQCIAEQLLPGSRVADIGSDHALLPVYLLQRGIAVEAVAGELTAGPLAAAQRGVRDAGLQAKIQVRQGNGLAVIEAGEVDAITIAGMGGALIRDILEAGRLQGKLSFVRQLVLQPNIGEDAVRRWLREHGWQLAGERIVEEDGKIYEVLNAYSASGPAVGDAYAAERFAVLGDGRVSDERLLQMGPYLMLEGSPTWRKKWELELRKMERISQQMSASELESARSRREALEREMEEIKEVLLCTHMDRPSSD